MDSYRGPPTNTKPIKTSDLSNSYAPRRGSTAPSFLRKIAKDLPSIFVWCCNLTFLENAPVLDPVDLMSLSVEQKRVVDLVLNGKNVFFTGMNVIGRAYLCLRQCWHREELFAF